MAPWLLTGALVCGVMQVTVADPGEPSPPQTSLQGRIRGPITTWVSAYGGIRGGPVRVTLRGEEGTLVTSELVENWWSRPEAPGEFVFAKLPPGVYDALIPRGFFAGMRFRPTRIWGIVVRPGENTLNITMSRGSSLERTGSPRCRKLDTFALGRLEGVVVNSERAPVWGAAAGLQGVPLRLVGPDRVVRMTTNLDAGGFYAAHDLPPGDYELQIPRGYLDGASYRPQVIRRLEIRAGTLTLLDVSMRKGAKTERIQPRPHHIPIVLDRG